MGMSPEEFNSIEGEFDVTSSSNLFSSNLSKSMLDISVSATCVVNFGVNGSSTLR